MDKIKYQEFLEHIKSEREELREDLINMPLNASKCKVGDFGCGWGYITWCLMHEIPNSECIGIDMFDPENPPPLGDEQFSIDDEQFSIDNVRSFFKEIDANQSPDFRIGDIVKGENLSFDFDLIYCKRVLYNIFNNGYAELNQAITNIAKVLKSNGWFCLVEIRVPQFKSVLEEFLIKANFIFASPRCVYRPYNTLEKYYPQYPYLIYQCKRQNIDDLSPTILV